jgi:hypothetical protein
VGPRVPDARDRRRTEWKNRILKDKDYDLISVIYHASQGCETTRQYASDAQRENDKEAAAFFNEALKLNAQLVQKGKELLKQRM